MGLEISRYGKRNHEQPDWPSTTSCDGNEKNFSQPIKYAFGNIQVLETAF